MSMDWSYRLERGGELGELRELPASEGLRATGLAGSTVQAGEFVRQRSPGAEANKRLTVEKKGRESTESEGCQGPGAESSKKKAGDQGR